MRLKDKVIIITGATSGIGKAIAIRAVKEGAKVLVHGIDQSEGQKVVDHLGKNAVLCIADLVDPSAPKKITDAAILAFGQIDGLVNNAAIIERNNLLQLTPEAFTKTITGQKNGRVAPHLDQHISHEINKNGTYYCKRLGAACDFLITDLPSTELVEWILQTKLPFDSLYFYSPHQPIHISYGQQHKRDIWTFNNSGIPTKKGIENWIKLAKQT